MARDPRIYFDPPKPRADQPAVKSGTGEEKGSPALKYLGKVAMLIPAEIVGAYQCAIGIIGTVPDEAVRPWLYRGGVVLCAIATALYMAKRMSDYEKKKHLWVFVLAFVIWAFGLSAEKLFWASWWTHESTRGLVLLFGSLWLGLFDLPEKLKPKTS